MFDLFVDVKENGSYADIRLYREIHTRVYIFFPFLLSGFRLVFRVRVIYIERMVEYITCMNICSSEDCRIESFKNTSNDFLYVI